MITKVLDSKSGNYLVTLVIGSSYIENWEKFFKNSWTLYAKRYDLGIILITEDLLLQSDKKWKKANWQKLLIPEILSSEEYTLCCYLDSDIMINPFSPNIFSRHVPGKVGVVSIRKNLPYPQEEVIKRLAFFRHEYLDKSYPLDSALFMSTKQLYEYHSLADQGDEFCSGVLLFNPREVREQFKNWFDIYDKSVFSITNGGEQTHINFHILESKLENFLDYRFQAIWAYEIAWNHTELFRNQFVDDGLLRNALSQCLANNFFLHFAGNSFESNLYKGGWRFSITNFFEEWNNYFTYQSIPSLGESTGTYSAQKKL